MTPCPAPVSSWHLSVGVGIALLGFFGVVVPWLRAKANSLERAAWMIVFFLLLLSELYSIREEQREHRREQEIVLCEQSNRFEAIAEKLEGDITTNQAHFDQTMESEKGILAQTKDAAGLARSNLENITGGDSFGYVWPFTTQANFTTLMLQNAGDEVLTGVHIVVEAFKNDCTIDAGALCIPEFNQGMHSPVEIGTVAAHQRIPVPRPNFSLATEANGTSHYNIRIYAQNGVALEEIWFRPSTVHRGYAYRFKVVRPVLGKPKKGDFKVGEEYMRTLKTGDWVEYSPSESLDGFHLYTRR
jgi:hypothetical protein